MAKSDLKRVLLDSSALLAFIKGEPGAELDAWWTARNAERKADANG